ncbi:putative T7SS-secreted protein [Nocardia sp. NPDC050378]|uniref:putative T7SS-secreted protein n=1 Tax=Nocardia sp. NPDC050378 TaxID=3155400 RepID=UPI0033DA920E
MSLPVPAGAFGSPPSERVVEARHFCGSLKSQQAERFQDLHRKLVLGIRALVQSGNEIAENLDLSAGRYYLIDQQASKVVKAVDAHGLSEWLDNPGDKVVDATGGTAPKKELGETTHPKELIRGDVVKINEVTGHLGKIGTAIEQTADALRKIDTADWTGDATTFGEKCAKQPKLW